MKRLLTYICCLCFVLPLAAQTSRADVILDQTAEAFRRAGGVEVGFTTKMPEVLPQSCVLRLKGEKFLLEASDGKIWFDGRTQWTYVAATDEVTVTEPTPKELQDINPYALLTLHKREYEAALASDDGDVYKIVLTPKEKKQGEQQPCLTLYIRKGTYVLARVSLAMVGDPFTVEIVIDSYKTKQAYTDRTFVFDKSEYPSAEVIDLR